MASVYSIAILDYSSGILYTSSMIDSKALPPKDKLPDESFDDYIQRKIRAKLGHNDFHYMTQKGRLQQDILIL